jgi:hypothetical protein
MPIFTQNRCKPVLSVVAAATGPARTNKNDFCANMGKIIIWIRGCEWKNVICKQNFVLGIKKMDIGMDYLEKLWLFRIL